jgi:hypothetical protein
MSTLSIANPALLVAGLAVLFVGLWMWRWSSRNAIDVKGAALGAAWQGVRQGRLDIPDDIKSRMNELANEGSNVGRAKKAGGMAIRHALAKVVGLAGLVAILAGLALSAAGVFWK